MVSPSPVADNVHSVIPSVQKDLGSFNFFKSCRFRQLDIFRHAIIYRDVSVLGTINTCIPNGKVVERLLVGLDGEGDLIIRSLKATNVTGAYGALVVIPT